MLKQNQADEITAKENKEKQFEPITPRLDKVKNPVKQTDEDLNKKLELIPFNKKVELSSPIKQVTFAREGGDEESINEANIKTIILKV